MRDRFVEQRERHEREKRIAKYDRLELPSEFTGETIHVAKKLYEGILRKVRVTEIRPIGGAGGRIRIEYEPKRGGGHGVLELHDIGPAPITP